MKAGILGAGSWGTALAVQLARKNEVRVWEYDAQQVAVLNETRVNEKFLPGISIPEEILFTTDMAQVVRESDVIFFVIPSHVLRKVAHQARSLDFKEKHIVSLVKGLEDGTYKRMTEIIAEEIGPCKSLSALSGPSHAEEVSRKIPTAIILASTDVEKVRFLQQEISTDSFRVYLNHDILGVELGGAVKNVIAIAAGISDGLGFGSNTKSALITRGMEEMKRLAVSMGADEHTLFGLSGIGDLITTCISKFSRNRHVGEELGKGRPIEDILAGMVMVAEGVPTTLAVHHLSVQKGIEMPITQSVYNILYNHSAPASEVQNLMGRPGKEEFK